MGKSRAAQWGCLCATLILLASGAAAAESEGSQGFTLYERFQGSSNTLGLVTRLDTSIGYNFNRHFGVDAGIPVYFVRPSGAPPSLWLAGLPIPNTPWQALALRGAEGTHA